jgi:hypothetical protein
LISILGEVNKLFSVFYRIQIGIAPTQLPVQYLLEAYTLEVKLGGA